MTTDCGRVPDGTGQAEPVSRLDPPGFDPSRLKLEYYDKISRRIVDHHGLVVGLILQLSNGRWIIEVDDVRQYRWSAKTPQGAFIRWCDAIAMEARQGRDGETRLDAKQRNAQTLNPAPCAAPSLTPLGGQVNRNRS